MRHTYLALSVFSQSVVAIPSDGHVWIVPCHEAEWIYFSLAWSYLKWIESNIKVWNQTCWTLWGMNRRCIELKDLGFDYAFLQKNIIIKFKMLCTPAQFELTLILGDAKLLALSFPAICGTSQLVWLKKLSWLLLNLQNMAKLCQLPRF